MMTMLSQPPTRDIGACCVDTTEPPQTPPDARDLLDDLINELAEKHERISALRRSLPNDMLPGAVEAICNLGGQPGATVTGHGLKFLLSKTCETVSRDIDRLCALRRNLPEEFADPLAEEGFFLLLARFDYENQ